MSGSATVGGGTSTGGSNSSQIVGPFSPYTLLSAQALNAALIYGNKLGGTIDNSPIGQTTPSMGAFTVLTAQTPPSGDNSSLVATTAWVQSNGGSGGGGSISLNSPNFTGIPTAPTASSGTSTTQIATCAFVGNALSNDVAGTTYGGNGVAGIFRDNGSGSPTTINAFPWQSFNIPSPIANMQIKWVVSQACTMTGIYVQSPGASGGAQFPITMTQNGSSIGATYTGSLSSTSVNTFGSAISFSAGDILIFTVGAITGTPSMGWIQPVGNYA